MVEAEQPDLRMLVWQEAPEGSKVAVGDQVTMYELDEPYPFAHLPPHQHDSEALNTRQDQLRHTLESDDGWRHLNTLYCTKCPPSRGQGKSIVAVWLHGPSLTRWVSPRAQRKPAALGGLGSSEAWIMHGRTDQQPCPGSVASCPGCKSQWFVMSSESAVYLLGISGRFRHDSTVVE